MRSGENEPGRQGHVMRSVDKAVQRGFAHRMSRREADSPLASNLTLGNNFTDSNITKDFKETNINDSKKTNFNDFKDTNVNNFTYTHNLAVLTPLNLTILNRFK